MEVSCLIKTENPHILITGDIHSDGLGDLSAILKIADIIERYSPITLCLSISDPAFLANFDLTKYSIVYIDLLNDEMEELIEIVRKLAPSHIISFSMGKPFLNIQDIPIVNFGEYGEEDIETQPYKTTHKFTSYSLGLNIPGHPFDYTGIGIFQDPQLIAYFHDKKNKDALYRLSENLPHLSDQIFSAIIGKSKSKNALLEQIEAFSENNSLYFGYVSIYEGGLEHLRTFIGAMLLLDREKHPKLKNLVFVIPGFPKIKKTLLSSEFTSFLVSQGVGLISFATLSPSLNPLIITSLALDSPSTGAQITLVSGSLSHTDFVTLIKASEEESISTGDQSTSEILTAGKRLFYQTRSHKASFANSLAYWINKICNPNSVNFQPSNITRVDRPLIKKIAWLYDHYKKISISSWDLFIQEIHTNQNCEQRILKAVFNV